MPDLIANERQRSMLFIENNFLYCFMGLSQDGILDSVERINSYWNEDESRLILG